MHVTTSVDREQAARPIASGARQPQLAALVSRDPAAERAFYDAHVDRVFRLCLRMTSQETLAEECTQDTFVRAFEKIAEFRGDAALSTWLHAIAVSVVLNAIRREKRSDARQVELSAAHHLSAVVREAEPDLKERLQQAVSELPQGYRTVFVLHDVEGFTHEEIGQALGVATGTSKTQLFHARRKLRHALSPFWKTGDE